MDLIADLKGLGLEPHDRILVHTAFRQIGPVPGGAESLIDALLSVAGTVLFPTLTGSAEQVAADSISWRWDQLPEDWVGVVPKVATERHAKTGEGCRSEHPTHSAVAFGTEAEAATRDHAHSPTPCGVGSPYHWLSESGGKIVLIGCTPSSNTSLHMAEELAEVPYHLRATPTPGTMLLRDGTTRPFLGPLHQWGVDRSFEVTDEFPHIRGHVGNAVTKVIDARGLRDWVVAELRRQPEFLLASRSR